MDMTELMILTLFIIEGSLCALLITWVIEEITRVYKGWRNDVKQNKKER